MGVAVIDRFDFDQLMEFMASVLLKASVSSLEEFKGISLGEKYLSQVKKISLEGSASGVQPLDFFMMRYKPSDDGTYFEQSFATPYVLRDVFGLKWIAIRVLDWEIRVKVDNRPARDLVPDFLVKRGSPISVMVGNFKDTKEFRHFTSIVKRARSN